MATPKILKDLDDILRQLYKPLAINFVKEFLKKNNVPDVIIDQVEALVPNAETEADVVKGLINEIESLKHEALTQEKLIYKLVELMAKNGVKIDANTRLEIFGALNG